MKEQYVRLKEAFIDIMDGIRPHDLQGMTGLSRERCNEIYDEYLNLTVKAKIPNGTYECYGNTVVVSDNEAQDIDSGESIPIDVVKQFGKFIRS